MPEKPDIFADMDRHVSALSAKIVVGQMWRVAFAEVISGVPEAHVRAAMARVQHGLRVQMPPLLKSETERAGAQDCLTDFTAEVREMLRLVYKNNDENPTRTGRA